MRDDRYWRSGNPEREAFVGWSSQRTGVCCSVFVPIVRRPIEARVAHRNPVAAVSCAAQMLKAAMKWMTCSDSPILVARKICAVALTSGAVPAAKRSERRISSGFARQDRPENFLMG
jgi:hypothetical protein